MPGNGGERRLSAFPATLSLPERSASRPISEFMSSSTAERRASADAPHHRLGRNRRWLFRFWRTASESRKDALQLLAGEDAAEEATNVLAASTRSLPDAHELEQRPAPDAELLTARERSAPAQLLEPTTVLKPHDWEAEAVVDPLASFHGIVMFWLYHSRNAAFDKFWTDVEQRTGFKRETVSYTVFGVLLVSLVLGNLSEVVCSLVGVAYPLICTYEMLKLEPSDVPEPLRRHWLHYWCIYGLLTCLDFLARTLQAVIPFVQIGKAAILFAVALPDFQLSQPAFDLLVQPTVRILMGVVRKYAPH